MAYVGRSQLCFFTAWNLNFTLPFLTYILIILKFLLEKKVTRITKRTF